MLALCSMLHSLKFAMQHDHVLKKLHFDLLTPPPRVWGLQGKYLLHCCCIHDSLNFDLHRDHVLKKFNFDLLTSPPII